MLQNAREYKVYLPLTYPDGKPVEAEKRYAVRARLLECFGGVTIVRQANYLEGFWLAEEEVIPDQIVIYTAVDLRHPGMENETFMLEYKEELKREFRQQEVFITVSDLQLITNIMNEFENLSSHEEIASRISHLQNSGNLSETIALCKELYSELEHQKQLAAMSNLTLGISHELGQPITNIRYTVQFYRKLLEKTFTKEVVFKVFDSILEETERMGGLIKRLSPLTSSRSVIEKFDLIDCIQKRVEAENAPLQEAKIVVNVSPETPIYLVSDPVKWEQLISNLLLNSIDAIKERERPEPNRIDIQVNEKKDEVQIIFTDTGVGIPAKNRGKIFDPFFSTKAPGKGEGLGLFIVWNLLKAQGGKISLDPNYKNGARFLISVPKTTQSDRRFDYEKYNSTG